MLRARILRHPGIGGLLAVVLALAALLAPRTARAEPGDELTVYVLTFGPGDHPFYKFGHDAIWIHNAAATGDPLKRDPVYNWGTFAFGDPALIPKFILGRFLYWLSKAPIGWTVRAYQAENRSVEAQELNLTAAQKKMLFDMLEENAKEENKYYRYDYYRDNCATRVRDAIDKVIGGKLKEASQEPASMTWRAHTLRLTADDAVLSMALDVVMGSVIDQRINQWQEMFLPAYVQTSLRRVKVPGPNGTEIPLVKSERALATAKRPPLRTEPPSWGVYCLLVGLAFGGGIFGAARFAKKRNVGAQIGLGLLLFLAGALSILGLLFVFAWVATDHEVGWHNENILQITPWAVALMGYAIGVARLKPRAVRRARWLVMVSAGASIFGLVWKVLPWMRQDNYWIIAFAMPLWVGATLGLRELEAALEKGEEAGKKEPEKKAAEESGDEKAAKKAPAKKAPAGEPG
jgi:hypothetical protein